MVIFLGSWAVMFAALFLAFAMYRLTTPEWPPPILTLIPQTIPAVVTALIILSSITLMWGNRAYLKGHLGRLRRHLAGTTILALAFMGLQVAFWSDLLAKDVTPAYNIFSGHLYLLTLFHGLHVLVGLALLVNLYRKTAQLVQSNDNPNQLALSLKLTSMFWHFVGVAWIFTFLLLFIL